MKSICKDKSGFALINVIVGLIIISLTIAMVVNFNSYIGKEEQISKEEFSFYTEVSNIVEEAYATNWDDLKLSTNKPNVLNLNKVKSVDYYYDFLGKTEYGTDKLTITFKNPPGSSSDELIYNLEKNISDNSL